MSAPPLSDERSSCLKSFASRSPENSSSISLDARICRSRCSIFSSMRANASNALFSASPDIVSLMRFCACARRSRARSRFFFRFASSILSFRSRSAVLSFSVSWRCVCQVSSSCWACSKCSL